MAPNLAIKSESWLDLTLSVPAARRRTLTHANGIQSPYNHRHSIGTLEQHESLRFNANRVQQSLQQQQQHRLSTSSREHLLIRLRQQSYLNNRTNSTSSASLASTNLSRSIELNLAAPQADYSVSGARARSLSELGSQNMQRQADALPVGCEKPRTRLERMKAKLARGNRRPHSRSAKTTCNSTATVAASPLARSLSSFSERIGAKLDHFRHSWKHFLYNYNQQRNKTPGDCLEDEPECVLDACRAHVAADQLRNDAVPGIERTMDKRRLTGLWVERHRDLGKLCSFGEYDEHQSSDGKQSRPKSSDISRAVICNRRQCQARSCSQATNQQHTKSESNRRRIDINRYSLNFEAQTKQNLSQDLEHLTRNSSSTTATLVSKQPASLESISSTSTVNSREMNKQVKSSKSNHAKNKHDNDDELSPSDDKRHAPTSDYWSTVASSDYYKQQMFLQQQQHQNNNQLSQVRQPILLASDQSEYYLDVASAARMAAVAAAKQQQQQYLLPADSQSATMLQQRSDGTRREEQQSALLSANQFMPTDLSSLTVSDRLDISPLTPMPVPLPLLNQQQHLQLHHQVAIEEPDYCDDDYAVPADETGCRLDRSQVELVQMIGEGQKGYVFLGKLQSKDGLHIQDVAIKTLKYETEQLIEKLIREAAMMRQFEHPHIIKFLGVCPETPALIAMELAEFGEIKHYLKLHRHLIIASQLVLFTFQISTALSYLESKQFVHRDVAARNVLVCSHSCVKLADFGLSRSLQQAQAPNSATDEASDQQQYVAAPKVKLPVRWLAPESLAFRRFTSASDVWMFAVCSWELFQFGQVRPWAHIRNNQVLLAIESGQRLARPPTCPARLYQLMLQCWSYAPVQRPKFRDLKQSLWSIYLTERAREQMELEQHQQQQQLQHIQQQQQMQQQLHLQQRRMLAAERYLHQQQQQQHQIQQQQLDQQRLLMLWSQQNQLRVQAAGLNDANQHQRLSASPSNANYSSNLSGYSSATVDMSNNSSRSSSMGSLARNAQQQLQQLAQVNNSSCPSPWKQQRQMSAGTPVLVPSPTAKPVRSPLASPKSELTRTKPSSASVRTKKLGRQHEIEVEFSDDNGKNLDEKEEKRKRVESNMRRFQKTPGHLLQKQRSQDSIANFEQHKRCEQVFNSRGQQLVGGLHLEQPALASARSSPTTRRSVRRPLSALHLAPGILTADDSLNEEEDDESSETDNSANECMQPLPVPSCWRDKRGMVSLKTNRQPVSIEHTYEGVQAGEMQRQPTTVPFAVQQTGNNARQVGRRPPLDTKAESLSEEDAAGHMKLANILQTLKISPMKAKLTYNSSSNNNNNLNSNCQQVTSSSSTQSNQQQVIDGRALDQQRQLAIHQRLLGHIRLSPQAAASTKRQQLEDTSQQAPRQQQHQIAGRAESVDQSLQLLESLISEKSGNGNIKQQRAKSQNNELNHHHYHSQNHSHNQHQHHRESHHHQMLLGGTPILAARNLNRADQTRKR